MHHKTGSTACATDMSLRLFQVSVLWKLPYFGAIQPAWCEMHGLVAQQQMSFCQMIWAKHFLSKPRLHDGRRRTQCAQHVRSQVDIAQDDVTWLLARANFSGYKGRKINLGSFSDYFDGLHSPACLPSFLHSSLPPSFR